MTRFPDVGELRAILAVMKLGSLTKAATHLGTTQSTLSYLLERLRLRMGDPLFVRVGNRMEPTPYAERLAESAEHILAFMEAEFDRIEQFDPSTTAREFHVVLTEIGAVTMLPAIVKQLAQLAPCASLVPSYPRAVDLEQALSDKTVDLVIGNHRELAGDHLFRQLLFRRSYVCIASREHPAIGERLSLAEFAAAPQVRNFVAPQAFRWMQAHMQQQNLEMNVQMVLEHATAVPFLVGASNMIALVSGELYELFGAVANIKIVALPVELPEGQICQYWHPAMNRDPAVTFLRGMVHRLFSSPDRQSIFS
ncbi:LysR family transcriptional regulator [Pigmentiphaga humi]|nr:LysR family transcriptional regulator [Pigmentiphaga humi]